LGFLIWDLSVIDLELLVFFFHFIYEGLKETISQYVWGGIHLPMTGGLEQKVLALIR
jgi:hypothetical protein